MASILEISEPVTCFNQLRRQHHFPPAPNTFVPCPGRGDKVTSPWDHARLPKAWALLKGRPRSSSPQCSSLVAGQVLSQLRLAKLQIPSLLISKWKSRGRVPRVCSAPIKASENFDTGFKQQQELAGVHAGLTGCIFVPITIMGTRIHCHLSLAGVRSWI